MIKRVLMFTLVTTAVLECLRMRPAELSWRRRAASSGLKIKRMTAQQVLFVRQTALSWGNSRISVKAVKSGNTHLTLSGFGVWSLTVYNFNHPAFCHLNISLSACFNGCSDVGVQSLMLIYQRCCWCGCRLHRVYPKRMNTQMHVTSPTQENAKM